MATPQIQLDLSQRGMESTKFEAALRLKIVGQNEAVQAVVDLYQVFRAGLTSRKGIRRSACEPRCAHCTCLLSSSADGCSHAATISTIKWS